MARLALFRQLIPAAQSQGIFDSTIFFITPILSSICGIVEQQPETISETVGLFFKPVVQRLLR